MSSPETTEVVDPYKRLVEDAIEKFSIDWTGYGCALWLTQQLVEIEKGQNDSI